MIGSSSGSAPGTHRETVIGQNPGGGSERGAGFAPARLGLVGGMSAAGDCERGDVGQEDSAAAGPFRFSPEPTLEDM